MKVRAAMSDCTPCSMPEMVEFSSIAEVREEFSHFVNCCHSTDPVADVFYLDCDEMLCRFKVGPRGGIVREAA